MMRLKPSSPVSSLARDHLARIALIATLLLASAVMLGCAQTGTNRGSLAQEVHTVGCVSNCRATKDSCDARARYEYQQCEAKYNEAFRNYRSCRAKAIDEEAQADCGYPWWQCAENYYGYCANRFNECRRSCAATPASLSSTSQP